MASRADSDSRLSKVKNLVGTIVVGVLFPTFNGWKGARAIIDGNARDDQSRQSGRWPVGEDAVEFGISLICVAIAAHVLMYLVLWPQHYHTIVSLIAGVAVCAGVVF